MSRIFHIHRCHRSISLLFLFLFTFVVGLYSLCFSRYWVMLYIPVCICLRPAHGMRWWFPSVTSKNKFQRNKLKKEKKKKVCFKIFFFYSLKTWEEVGLSGLSSVSRSFFSPPIKCLKTKKHVLWLHHISPFGAAAFCSQTFKSCSVLAKVSSPKRRNQFGTAKLHRRWGNSAPIHASWRISVAFFKDVLVKEVSADGPTAIHSFFFVFFSLFYFIFLPLIL